MYVRIEGEDSASSTTVQSQAYPTQNALSGSILSDVITLAIPDRRRKSKGKSGKKRRTTSTSSAAADGEVTYMFRVRDKTEGGLLGVRSNNAFPGDADNRFDACVGKYRGVIEEFRGYCSILVVSCFMLSGTLDSSSVPLSHPVIPLASPMTNMLISTLKHQTYYNILISYKDISEGIDTLGGEEMRSALSDQEITSGTTFFNCYCMHRDFKASDGEPRLRHSIVLVSRWPYHQLAFQVLSKLDDAFKWSFRIPGTCTANPKAEAQESSSGSPGSLSSYATHATPSKEGATANRGLSPSRNGQVHLESSDPLVFMEGVLRVGYDQIAEFPLPDASAAAQGVMYLTFLGETLQYNLPSLEALLPKYGPNLSLSAATQPINLVARLAPHGLLLHIWALWELIVTGKDVLILCTDPVSPGK